MFIHIGTVDIPLTTAKSDFFCPVCREQTDYAKKKKKRFLAVYFIPVIPIQDLDEYVKCKKCRQQFGVEIPELMSDAQAAAQVEANTAHDHILRMMILMMIADGVIDQRELAVIRDCHARSTDESLADSELRRRAAWADQSYDGVASYARRHADELTLEEQQKAVRHVFLVATASGELNKPQEIELTQLPEAFEMSEEMYRNLIEEASLGRV